MTGQAHVLHGIPDNYSGIGMNVLIEGAFFKLLFDGNTLKDFSSFPCLSLLPEVSFVEPLSPLGALPTDVIIAWQLVLPWTVKMGTQICFRTDHHKVFSRN